LAICGCGSSTEGAPPAESHDLAFDFHLDSKPGFMSQVLEIENRGESGLAPLLAITPLDASGDPMAGVTVKTAYGSDKGRVVAPPRSIVVDVLRFEGSGARDVEDVDVSVKSADKVSMRTEAGDLPVQRLDRAGRPVTIADFFDAYRVKNDTAAEAKVRVVLIEWEDPPPGESQQALRVTRVSPLLTLPPNGTKTVRLPKALRGRVIGSVKAYYSR
jgi:hypothetical protein